MPGNTYNLTKRSELVWFKKFTKIAQLGAICKRIAPNFNELVEKVKHLVDIVVDEGVMYVVLGQRYPAFVSYVNGDTVKLSNSILRRIIIILCFLPRSSSNTYSTRPRRYLKF